MAWNVLASITNIIHHKWYVPALSDKIKEPGECRPELVVAIDLVCYFKLELSTILYIPTAMAILGALLSVPFVAPIRQSTHSSAFHHKYLAKSPTALSFVVRDIQCLPKFVTTFIGSTRRYIPSHRLRQNQMVPQQWNCQIDGYPVESSLHIYFMASPMFNSIIQLRRSIRWRTSIQHHHQQQCHWCLFQCQKPCPKSHRQVIGSNQVESSLCPFSRRLVYISSIE